MPHLKAVGVEGKKINPLVRPVGFRGHGGPQGAGDGGAHESRGRIAAVNIHEPRGGKGGVQRPPVPAPRREGGDGAFGNLQRRF